MQPILCDRGQGDWASVRYGRARFSQDGAPAEVWKLRRIKTVPDPLHGPCRVHDDDLSAHDVAIVRWKLCCRALRRAGDHHLFVTNNGRRSIRKADRLMIKIQQRLLARDWRLQVCGLSIVWLMSMGFFSSDPGCENSFMARTILVTR